MAIQPWYKVTFPREDLRDGKPLDASEFAVHLDHVREKRAPEDYQKPERFFSRTFMTKSLTELAAQAVRRLSGIKTETSAVFNLATQFGGGKTHALTLLYHLANHSSKAKAWPGVDAILAKAEVGEVPKAATAVFVGTEFDSITGRGGDDGTPLRKTPWGEIAFQLSGKEGLAVVAEHEKQMTAPSGEVIRKFLPKNKPCLILMDELMNYVSRFRKAGMGGQLYNFLQNLSETARGQDNVVLVVSIPASEMEMNIEDQADFDRYKKMLDRLGKAIIMSAESESSEIIRRRLFDWDGTGGLSKEAEKTVAVYAEWVRENRTQLPSWFPVDNARQAFRDSYPFHPVVLSVFERKWQALPRFQQTRGMLRLLALWVSKAYADGYKGAHKDPLIGLGTAPLDDPYFRTAVFEQLGEARLEGAVTTDICGKKDAHSDRLDREAEDEIKKARLHRKIATSILFESNGGMLRHEATVPELRLAVGEPDMNIGHVETILETLGQTCYYLSIDRNKYRFGLSPNLNKLLSDRRASIKGTQIDERVRSEIQKVFASGSGADRFYFPEKSSQIPDRAALTLAVLSPDHSMEDADKTKSFVEGMTKEYGKSSRTFKSAVIWCVPEAAHQLRDEARKALAWEYIKDEDEGRLDESQRRQLDESIRRSKKDLIESVWRTYKILLVLDKDNSLKTVDLGLINSSQAADLISVILKNLRENGDLEKDISPQFLVRHWPAMTEWSVRAVRDAFFASPLLPRLLNGDSIKDTVARGVANKQFAYVGKNACGEYAPFIFGQEMSPMEVEISDEVFIVKSEDAKKHIEPPKLTSLVVSPLGVSIKPGNKQTFTTTGVDQFGRNMDAEVVNWSATGGSIDGKGVFTAGKDEGSFVVSVKCGSLSGSASVVIAVDEVPTLPPPPPNSVFKWSGEVPPQKWMNFYTKVLSKYATSGGLKITVNVEASPDGGVSEQRIQESKSALRELGLSEDIDT